MKTIEQLLKLSNNPYFKMSDEEKEVLEDFLSKQKGEEGQTSQQKNTSESSKKTRVTVRNVVQKAQTGLPEDV